MARRYIPARGDAIWVTFTPQRDMSKRAAARLWCCRRRLQWESGSRDPVSDHKSGERLSVRGGDPRRSRINGVILADQVKSLYWRVRQAEFICKLPRQTIAEVLEKLGALLFDAS